MASCKSGLRAVLVAGLAWFGGCAEEAAAVHPRVVVDGVTSPISAGSVLSLNGTYTNCLERSGAWSIDVAVGAPLTNPELSVIAGDTGCQLALTEIISDVSNVGAAPLALQASFQAQPVTFSPSGGGAQFYVNAKLNASDFGSDFVISVVHSGNPELLDAGAVSATYATVQASNQATVVTAPNYTISFTTGTALTLQLDASKNVTSVAGAATLVDGSILGSSYVIDPGTLGTNPSYLAVQVAFLARPATAISGANPTIPASSFGLQGVSLASPVVRTVIVGRLLGGVLGYELIKVTFKSP